VISWSRIQPVLLHWFVGGRQIKPMRTVLLPAPGTVHATHHWPAKWMLPAPIIGRLLWRSSVWRATQIWRACYLLQWRSSVWQRRFDVHATLL
jgi:hypothetical protein